MKHTDKKSNLSSVITGICLVFFSAALIVLVIPWQVPEGAESTSLSPNFFPLLAAAVILLLSLTYTVSEVRGFLQRPAKPTSEAPAHSSVGRVGVAFASMVLYTVAIGIFGFLASSAAFLLFFVAFLGSKRWMVTMGIAVVASLLIYFLFAYVMKVPLPGWLEP